MDSEDYTLTNDSDNITLTPKGEHTETIVWLHGLDNSGTQIINNV